ncbi:hypothetical protein KIV45_15820 [Janthinobacterium lividum]|nr:hypothetical protein KIV45_15820 [Janthinobacterium lividum]
MIEILTRAVARHAGLGRYFTGKPCAHGHVTERYTANALCVGCTSERNKSEKQALIQKEIRRRPANLEKGRLSAARYHAENRSEVLAKMSTRNRKYYEKNKERIKMETAAYQAANSEARNAYKSKWMTARAKVDPEFAMLLVMRKHVSRMMDRIKAKRLQSARTTEIVGYTPAEFVAHIEPMFESGMTWQNHGEWHIDHIRPLASFDLTDPEQQRMANSLHNLQPMWARPNLQKSDSWSGQASLI